MWTLIPRHLRGEQKSQISVNSTTGVHKISRLWRLTMLAVCLAGVPHPAQAARFTGAYLLQLCEKDANGRETEKNGHAACQSYISGVIDYHSVLRSLDIAPRIDICIPDNVSLNTVHDVVLNYLQRHGEHDPFIAAPAVMMALYEVYPCKGKR